MIPFRRILSLLILIVFIALLPLGTFAQTIDDWMNEPGDWWDTIRRSARVSYDFRDSQEIQWYRDPDSPRIRATIGSISNGRYYVEQEIQLTSPIIDDRMYFRFRHYRHEEYNIDETVEMAELEYRLPSGLMFGVGANAYHEKEDTDIGFILGWYNTPNNYLRCRYIAHRYLYNDKNNEWGTYDHYPYQFTLDFQYDMGKDWRVIGQGEIEFSWRLSYEDPFSASSRRDEGDRGWLSLRIQKESSNRIYGFAAELERDSYTIFRYNHVNETASRNRRIQNLINLRCFLIQHRDPWMFEFNLPLEYFSDDITRALKHPDYNRFTESDMQERTAYEGYPQAICRRYFGLGNRPYLEAFTLYMLRDLEEINSEQNKDRLPYNWRIGIGAGYEFYPRQVDANGMARWTPRGEILVRVTQSLVHSWYGNFGGGNLSLVLTW